LPNTVASIGEQAFSYSNLASITLPDSLQTIGKQAFYCSRLESIIIPSSITEIPESAFSGCILTNIVLPDHLTSIGDYAFNGNRNLSNVTIPSSVTSIGYGAFLDIGGRSSTADSSDHSAPALIVTAGSYAEQYAKDNSLSYDVVSYTTTNTDWLK